jgi:hypothetical protein
MAWRNWSGHFIVYLLQILKANCAVRILKRGAERIVKVNPWRPIGL